MTVKERFEAIKIATEKYLAEIETLSEGLDTYIDAARLASSLGLTKDSSPEQVADAFAATVEMAAPVRDAIPTVLQAGAPAEIQKAGEEVLAGKRQLGQMVGALIGTIAGLAT